MKSELCEPSWNCRLQMLLIWTGLNCLLFGQRLILNLLLMAQGAFLDSVDQDQTAQNV